MGSKPLVPGPEALFHFWPFPRGEEGPPVPDLDDIATPGDYAPEARLAPPPAPQPGLARRLGTGDAVVIGLGSMIGAGVFAAFAPAADAAGTGMLIGLAIAAVVAYCNATASAQLAAQYPTSGGTYVYGRERLGEWWGFLAGWGFVAARPPAVRRWLSPSRRTPPRRAGSGPSRSPPSSGWRP